MRPRLPALLALAGVATLTLAPLAPLAVRTPFSPAFGSCLLLSGGASLALLDCMAQENSRLERKLSDSWNTTLARLPDNAAGARRQQSQAEWLKTRWTGCNAQTAPPARTGGDNTLLMDARCRLGVIAQRIAWLQSCCSETIGSLTTP